MISWGNHEIIMHHPRAAGEVPYKYALLRRKLESNCSAVSTLSPLGMVGMDVRQLGMASSFARVTKLREMAPAKVPLRF